MPELKSVNQKLLEIIKPEQVEVEFRLIVEEEEGIAESELDEMWSYVGKKTNQRWLWHAIDRLTGQIIAYTFGQRKDEVFLQLKKLLEPFGIKNYCTDVGELMSVIYPARNMRWERRKLKELSGSI